MQVIYKNENENQLISMKFNENHWKHMKIYKIWQNHLKVIKNRIKHFNQPTLQPITTPSTLSFDGNAQ